MSNALTPTVVRDDAAQALARVVLDADLSKLTDAQKVTHYNAACQSIGVNPITQPFGYLRLSGKEVLYAKKDCTDQLRTRRRVSVELVDRAVVDGALVVTARARMPDGRADEDIGVVPVGDLKGEARANAMMKAVTKAKRRVTLSICGLGFLDESEIGGIDGAQIVPGPEAAPRDVKSRVQEERRGFPLPAPRALDAPAPAEEEELPLVWSDKKVYGLPGIDRWRARALKAVSSVQSQDKLSDWLRDNEPHFKSIGVSYGEQVDEVRDAAEQRRKELSQEPADAAE
jgi:hypothetical protein